MKNRKLRLLLWEACDKNCSGCCNKDWDIANLPEITLTPKNLRQYDSVFITGGEPMLNPVGVLQAIGKIKKAAKAEIILYTADVTFHNALYLIMELIDGMTITLHSTKDVNNFIRFLDAMPVKLARTKSMRLNVFSNVRIEEQILTDCDKMGWNVKTGITWIKNCPLPKGEDFKKIKWPDTYIY